MYTIIYHNSQKDYDEISTKCRQFTVSLLDECRTSEEVELLLKKEDPQNIGVQYPRLKLAMDMGVKEVCSN